VHGCELFDEIVKRGTFSEGDAAKVIVQIANALKYLHEQNIVHRDLKPENLLFSNAEAEVLKLADFGLAKVIGPDATLKTPCGTPACVGNKVLKTCDLIITAPEVLLCKGYGAKVDLWGLGVILYILLSGMPPFGADLAEDNLAGLYEQILKGEYYFDPECWDDVSEEGNLLSGIWRLYWMCFFCSH
jgi:calcium/calmodulin-dependent protein kinase I